MPRISWAVFVLFAAAASAQQASSSHTHSTQSLISISAPVFVLDHVRVIDGNGGPSRADQAVVVSHGRIVSVGAEQQATIPAGALRIDASGESVLPGIVGLHDHLYYSASIATEQADGFANGPGFYVTELPYTAPRLYLASGVTTMRTTGSVEPYTDLRIASQVNSGAMPGPGMDVSAPYLEGSPTKFAQMHPLVDATDARRMVDFWSSEGMTSFKAYMDISRAELGAAIAEAHAQHHKLTGHLCSVTWPEAIALGIDDLEHGPVFTDTEFSATKKPDACPTDGERSWQNKSIDDPDVQSLIHLLVAHHVAVTSTLPVFEAMAPGRPPLTPRITEALAPAALQSYLTLRARIPANSPMTSLFRKEMDFELAFVRAGGLLLAGPDPTGNGGVLPGFGDQREMELLVEAGFTPVEAIAIATRNGAEYLGQLDRIGTIAPGKDADIVLVHGDPSSRISDIENVVTVFKDGVGYDSAALIRSVRGQVGIW
jgi:hypothetical protein